MGKWVSKTVTTTGSDGSATGESDIDLLYDGGFASGGLILDVYVDYGASQPATTDVTLSEVMPTGSLRTIVVCTNDNSDNDYVPMKNAVDNAGAAIAGQYVLYSVANDLRVSVAGANAGAPAVTVSLLIE